MEITQSYARPSSGTLSANGMQLSVAAELSRPPVALRALVQDSLAYARVMLALYAVVSGDHRAKPKDHTAYQEWVQQRYLEELGDEMGRRLKAMPGLNDTRDTLKARGVSTPNRCAAAGKTTGKPRTFTSPGRFTLNGCGTTTKTPGWCSTPWSASTPTALCLKCFRIDESSYGRGHRADGQARHARRDRLRHDQC